MTTIIQHTKNTLQGLTRDFHDRQNFSHTLTTEWSEESEEELVNPSNSFVYIQFANNPPWMSDRLANYSASLLMSRLSEIPGVRGRELLQAALILCITGDIAAWR